FEQRDLLPPTGLPLEQDQTAGCDLGVVTVADPSGRVGVTSAQQRVGGTLDPPRDTEPAVRDVDLPRSHVEVTAEPDLRQAGPPALPVQPDERQERRVERAPAALRAERVDDRVLVDERAALRPRPPLGVPRAVE